MSDFDTVRDALDYLHGDGLCDCHDAHAALARIKAAYVEMEKATAYHYRVEDVLAENRKLRKALDRIALDDDL